MVCKLKINSYVGGLLSTLILLGACSGKVSKTTDSPAAGATSKTSAADDLVSLSAISPNRVLYMGGVNITVSGSGFSKNTKIYIDQTPCSFVSLTGTNKITCRASAMAVGTYNVRVLNPSGKVVELKSAIEFYDNITSTQASAIGVGGAVASNSSMQIQAMVGDAIGTSTNADMLVKVTGQGQAIPNITGAVFSGGTGN